jgi:hypothetical protein
MNMGMVREVMDIIANGYGSAPSGLDQAIASRVVDYFYRKGWMNSEDIAWLVKAAGGEIRVPISMIVGDSPYLVVWDDPATDERVFKIRERVDIVDAEEMVKNAKVNPDAESRNVSSGPIELNITE